MKKLKALLLAIPLLLPGYCLAQADDEAVRYYDVEVIIFKNIQVPKDEEFMLPVSLPLRAKEELDLSSPASIEAAQARSYTLLKQEDLRLVDKISKIIASPYYELLAHVGWRQPGQEKAKTMPIWIQGGKVFGDNYVSIDSQLSDVPAGPVIQPYDQTQQPPEIQTVRGTHEKLYELEGKISVALSRYLHTYTDLILRKPSFSLEDELDNPELAAALETSADVQILNNHSLKEHRRMRSKTLHYLDSPEFALLILITPYEMPDINPVPAQSADG
ncbi:MAG: hypothetical protein GY784_06850 [Gammaproteobacteria bacterium]|nr:hypothetical protein [Gammaproteobacteria bacterium]